MSRYQWIFVFLSIGIVLIVSGAWTYNIANRSTEYNIPKGAMGIGIGPSDSMTPMNTSIIFTVSETHDWMDLKVFFKFTEYKKYHIYTSMPYKTLSANPFVEYFHTRYETETSQIGNITANFGNFEDKGSSIINATFIPSDSFPFDPNKSVALGIRGRISGLTSIYYSLGSKQTVILTFFGDQTGVWDDAMASYIGTQTLEMVDCHLQVFVQFPKENYLASDTFPIPIGIFITERFRSAMFELDFSHPEGHAQSISCSYNNPANEGKRNLCTFISGIFLTLGITLCLESLRETRKLSGKQPSQENKPKEEEPEKQYDKTIQNLIRLVDRNKSKLFRTLDIFRGEGAFPFAAIILILVFIEIFLYFGVASSTEKITIALTFLAFAIAYFSLVASFGDENIVKVNFKRLESCVEKSEKPLLKALIRMKAKNREFDLEEIYSQTPLLFKREKLLESLYE